MKILGKTLWGKIYLGLKTKKTNIFLYYKMILVKQIVNSKKHLNNRLLNNIKKI